MQIVLRGFVGQADDLDFVAHLDHAALDTTGGHRAATFDREHVFDGHQERLVDFARRLGNVAVDRIHQLLMHLVASPDRPGCRRPA